MKKILLSISIILFTITLPLSAMHHDSHKNHGPMPFQKAMDKMHKDMMIKPSGNIDIDFFTAILIILIISISIIFAFFLMRIISTLSLSLLF